MRLDKHVYGNCRHKILLRLAGALACVVLLLILLVDPAATSTRPFTAPSFQAVHASASGAAFATESGKLGASGQVSHLADHQAQHNESSKRIAINFFGLTRSLSWTHESIKRNLLGPIQAAGYEVDLFLHTYRESQLDSTWSNERGVLLNTSEWQLLQPERTSFTSQTDFLAGHEQALEKCRSAGHGWTYVPQNDFSVVRNLFCQLNSIKEVNELWRAAHDVTPYSAVIFARPDVLFNCPLNVSYITGLKENTLVIPDHSHYKGMNDRFAIARPAVAYDYGQRLGYTMAECVSTAIHAELFALKWAKSRNYDVVRMPRFDFFRIRATGTVAPGDAMTLRGCAMEEMYKFTIPQGYIDVVRTQRRRAFREGTGWAALQGAATQMAQQQVQPKSWDPHLHDMELQHQQWRNRAQEP